MTKPEATAEHEALMSALVMLATRCGERDLRPSTSEARQIATELALEYQLSSDDRTTLEQAATRFAAPLIELPENDEGFAHHSLFRPTPSEPDEPSWAAVEEPDHPAPSDSRRWMLAVVAAAVVALAMTVFVLLRSPASRGACQDLFGDSRELAVEVAICQKEYQVTGQPEVGGRLARLLVDVGDLSAASKLANELRDGPATSDALYVLGKMAFAERKFDDSLRALESARALHTREQRISEIAADDLALAELFLARAQRPEALRAIDTCLGTSERARDASTGARCRVVAAMTLGELGRTAEAQENLELAGRVLLHGQDFVRLQLAHAELEQQLRFTGPTRRGASARVLLQQIIVRLRPTSDAALIATAEIMLATSLIELGELRDAQAHVAAVERIGTADEAELMSLKARLAFHIGDLATAGDLAAHAYASALDERASLAASTLRAEIALAHGDLEIARSWAVLAAQGDVSSGIASAHARSAMVPLRRHAYELLFVVLAEMHRVDDALAAFDDLRTRTVAQSLAGPPRTGAALEGGISTSPSSHEALGLHGVDLVALVVANEHLWRVSSVSGDLEILDLGLMAGTLEAAIGRFSAAPTQIDSADELGARLLGDAAFRATSEALFVMLDDPIGALPIPALRGHTLPLIAFRPVVRITRLSQLRCVQPRPGKAKALVLADPSGDLASARAEAAQVTAYTRGTPLLGAAATSRALLAAASDSEVLHVAAHTSCDSLSLYDREVSALEIARRDAAPHLVVLTACVSSSVHDRGLPSLVDGFLAAGAAQVVGALRPVYDVGASELAHDFYAQGGTADPVRTLARVQAQLAQTANTDWPNFAVFGNDTCEAR